jgi:hypothetical protein
MSYNTIPVIYDNTKIDIFDSIDIKIEPITDTTQLDYLSHLQTLKEFEKLYDNMYIHSNLYGQWEIK